MAKMAPPVYVVEFSQDGIEWEFATTSAGPYNAIYATAREMSQGGAWSRIIQKAVFDGPEWETDQFHDGRNVVLPEPKPVQVS